jgi:hypothetical protein
MTREQSIFELGSDLKITILGIFFYVQSTAESSLSSLPLEITTLLEAAVAVDELEAVEIFLSKET